MEAKTVRELGALIREARVTRGETQRDLAKRINVTQSMISKVEKGFPGASIGLVLQMLKGLGLSLSIGAGDKQSAALASDDDDQFDLDAIANTGLKRK